MNENLEKSNDKDLNLLKLALANDDFAKEIGELIARNFRVKPVYDSSGGKRKYETSFGVKTSIGLARTLINLLSASCDEDRISRLAFDQAISNFDQANADY